MAEGEQVDSLDWHRNELEFAKIFQHSLSNQFHNGPRNQLNL